MDKTVKTWAIRRDIQHYICEVLSIEKDKLKVKRVNFWDDDEKRLLGEVTLEELSFYEFVRGSQEFVFKKYLFDEKSNVGWIDPKGQFYPCDLHYHDNYARLVLESEPDVLEKLGWIRVEENKFNYKVLDRWRDDGGKIMSRFQKETLEKLGFTSDDMKGWLVL